MSKEKKNSETKAKRGRPRKGSPKKNSGSKVKKENSNPKIEEKTNDAFKEFEIPIDSIVLGDHQPRSREGIHARGSLTQLKESIRDIGLLQPILVQEQGGGSFLLISGERRYQSCKELGHKKIRAVLPSNRTIHALNERGKTLDELALFENLKRKNLTPIEEARCFDKLLELLGVTQEELGQRLGLKQNYISSRLGFLLLPEEIQLMIENEEITSSQAREIGRLSALDLPNDERESKQIEIAKKMIVEKITVRKAKKLVDELLGQKKRAEQLTRLSIKKAFYFISTLHDKFDEFDLSELHTEEDKEKLNEIRKKIPFLIEKLQSISVKK
jgi:ParB family chromosome partitioning protein